MVSSFVQMCQEEKQMNMLLRFIMSLMLLTLFAMNGKTQIIGDREAEGSQGPSSYGIFDPSGGTLADPDDFNLIIPDGAFNQSTTVALYIQSSIPTPTETNLASYRVI